MNALDAARQLLPAWVVWGPLYTYVPLVFLWSLAFTALGALLGGWPAKANAVAGPHAWVERARQVYPARLGTALLALFLPLFAAMMAMHFGGDLLPTGQTLLACGAWLSAWLAAAVVRFHVERRIYPALTARLFVSGTVVRGIFFLWPLLLVIVSNVASDNQFTTRTFAVLTAAGVSFVLLSLGGSTRLARMLGLVRPADERLASIIARVGADVGHQASRVWVARSGAANAWALFVNREMMWTTRALEVLDDEEIAAIAAHELGHLSESKAVTRVRILRLLLFFPLCGLRVTFVANAWAGTLLFVIFCVTMIAASGVSRRMEGRADEVAHAHEGDVGTYARALERIYEANSMPAVARGKGGVHGHLYDRMTAAGVTPSFTRPEPPARWRTSFASLLPLFVAVCGLLFFRIALVAYAAVDDGPQAANVVGAIGGVDHQLLSTMAEQADAAGDFERADVFFAAADAVLPTQPEQPPSNTYDDAPDQNSPMLK